MDSPQPKKKRLVLQIGAWAGILAAVLFRKNLSAEFHAIFRFIPGFDFIPAQIPEEVFGWFSLIQDQPFMGLVYLDFFDILNYILVGWVFFALFRILKSESPMLMYIALILGVMGILIYIIINPALMLFQSCNQYYTASNPAEELGAIMKAEQILTRYNPGAVTKGWAVYLSQFCFAAGGLLFSIQVKKSRQFSAWKGVLGIIAHGILLLTFPLLLIAPAYSYFPTVFAATFLLVWHFSVGISLLKYAKK